ncbi:hypothetical protein [Streptomyces sp. NPDC051561]|uniref:hypothetical protein n=1 Tax=Streptomyces sp. NPDC051561 TaxID=3365658 RepID=UPI0037910FDA
MSGSGGAEWDAVARLRLRRTLQLWALVLAGPCVLVTLGYLALVVIQPGSPAEPSREEIAGTWVSPEGGRLVFGKGGEFTGSGMTLPVSCGGGAFSRRADRAAGNGSWDIGSFPDEGPGAKVEFGFLGGKTVKECPMWAVLLDSPPSSPEIYLLQDDGTGERYRRSPDSPGR